MFPGSCKVAGLNPRHLLRWFLLQHIARFGRLNKGDRILRQKESVLDEFFRCFFDGFHEAGVVLVTLLERFARVTARNRVELLIWERGAGETRASGSSTCAVVAAAFHLGLVDAEVVASMPGGELSVRIDTDASLWLTGPVEEVARIILSAELIDRLRALP